ncbi:MAG: sigma-54 dependent transcriptional regulator [Clostridium sp.]|nr:sigma-54 dependent transcriptional regulator [Clostridium sp.]
MNTSEIQLLKKRYGVVGNSEGLNHALDIALQVAKTDLSVLITGESGVGKEVVPRMIHDNSLRKTKKYFAVNCGSIPEGTIDSELFGHEKGAFTGAIGEREGYFGAADGGTLFLDEVGELPLSTQARLLRVLETGEYIRVGSSEVRKTDVRIVAATNVNMAEAIREGRFREDLFYRLNTIPVKIPPLRERAEDVVLLFKKFAMETADKYNMPEPVELTDAAKVKLKNYPWPGNIRQLKNVTEQISILSRERVITPDILSEYVPDAPVSHDIVRVSSGESSHSFENEREILYKILFDLRNDVTELKKLVNSRNVSGGSAVTSPQGVDADRPVTFYSGAVAYPAARGAETQATLNVASPVSVKAEAEEIQTPEEYVEESLALNDWERQMIIRALEKNKGRRKGAAHDLNISERTLYRKIKEYGLDK